MDGAQEAEAKACFLVVGALGMDAEDKKLVEYMLAEVEEDLEAKGDTNDFIESLRSQFNRRGSLSEAQVEGLRKFYERI